MFMMFKLSSMYRSIILSCIFIQASIVNILEVVEMLEVSPTTEITSINSTTRQQHNYIHTNFNNGWRFNMLMNNKDAYLSHWKDISLAIFTIIMLLPYSRKYWRELNLAVEPKSLLQEY